MLMRLTVAVEKNVPCFKSFNYCVSSVSFGVATNLVRRDSSKWKIL